MSCKLLFGVISILCHLFDDFRHFMRNTEFQAPANTSATFDPSDKVCDSISSVLPSPFVSLLSVPLSWKYVSSVGVSLSRVSPNPNCP